MSWASDIHAKADLWRLEIPSADRASLRHRPVDIPLQVRLILQRALDEVAGGIGVALIRGFPTDIPLSHLEACTRACGDILGMRVAQNAAGEDLVHVCDRSSTGTVRGYMSREPLAFHTDAPDLIGLLCVRRARSGGATHLASSMRIYQALVDNGETAVLQLLERGFHYAYPEQLADPAAQLGPKVPVFSQLNGQVSCRYLRAFIELAQQRFGVVLTESQRAALDRFDELASREEMRIELHLDPGDLLLVNNYTVLHARSAFEDYAEAERRRLLLRLWLMVPNLRAVQPLLRSLGTRFVVPVQKTRDRPTC